MPSCKISKVGLLAALVIVLSACSVGSVPALRPSSFRREELSLPGQPWGRVRYLLFVPENVAEKPAWPLLLFLHGSGERGSDLSLVETEGLPWLLRDRHRFPFVVAAPQAPAGATWSPAVLETLVDHLVATLPVDPDRVSVTGLSTGGSAALELAARRPARVAGVVAVSIHRGPADPCRLRGVPVWILHNRGDERIPVGTSAAIARRLEACGARVTRTVYPDPGHDAWTLTYGRREVYDWLLGLPASSARALAP